MSGKIYTKRGDKGETSLFGGKRLLKNHIRIEAYGTVDELNASIGLVRDAIAGDKETRDFLEVVQNELFDLGSNLALDPDKKLVVPTVEEESITLLEKAIDRMNDDLPELKSFILPGGHPLVSTCHMARCICRRAERRVVALSEESKVDSIHFQYLNRLSDYLFVLSRKLAKDLGVREIHWRPLKK